MPQTMCKSTKPSNSIQELNAERDLERALGLQAFKHLQVPNEEADFPNSNASSNFAW